MLGSLILEISEHLEEQLARDAEHLGLTLEQHVMNLLGDRLEPERSMRTGAEIADLWRREGPIGSLDEIDDIDDSRARAREIRLAAEKRLQSQRSAQIRRGRVRMGPGLGYLQGVWGAFAVW